MKNYRYTRGKTEESWKLKSNEEQGQTSCPGLEWIIVKGGDECSDYLAFAEPRTQKLFRADKKSQISFLFLLSHNFE